MNSPLILSEIFNFLTPNEKLQMRLVCKEWQSFVNHFEQREELCMYEKRVPFKLKWSSDGRYVREAIQVRSSKLNFKDPFLKNLKRLLIHEIESPDLLGHLNNLTNLEELSFKCGGTKELSVKLNLPNLKTLILGIIDEKLVLNTPKLESLDIYQFPDNLHIVYPNSIRFVKCVYFYHTKGTQFPNLRRLVARYIPHFKLKNFPKLQVVELYGLSYAKVLNLRLIKFAESLKKQCSVLGRSDLRILINGFEGVENRPTICEMGMLTTERFFEILVNNFDKMTGDFEFPIDVNYSLMLKYWPTSEMRRRFMAKFKMIERIYVNYIPNHLEFFEFLNDSGPFLELIMEYSDSSVLKVFSDRQLVAFQSIRRLSIEVSTFNLNLQLLSGTLFDLKNLRDFELYTCRDSISVEFIYLAAELFKRSRNFAKFILSYVATIRRSDTSGLTYNKHHFPGKTLEEIFEMFFMRLPPLKRIRK